MSARTSPSEARLKTILSRQAENRFGKHYDPSIHACREEAPVISRASRLASAALGRDVHCLSEPERMVAQIVLYHIDANPIPGLEVLELQEQRMIPAGPALHPMVGHPKAAGVQLPDFKGSVSAADRLGCLSRHTTVLAAVNAGEIQRVPFPFIGDLLVFLKDSRGPYCTNLTVKSARADFESPPPGKRRQKNRASAIQAARDRHAIEAMTYADINIPTYRVAADELDVNLCACINQLYLTHSRDVQAPAASQEDIVEVYRICLNTERPPLEVIPRLMARHNISRRDCLTILHQAIWRRQLHVDIWTPILPDLPLRPECRDIGADFSSWFKRG